MSEAFSQVLKAAIALHQFCEERRWPFCMIGGLVVRRWGEVRVTEDVDITLLTGWENEESYLETLLGSYRFNGGMTMRQAVEGRVAFLLDPNGVEVDIALGGTPFEARSIQRSTLWDTGEAATLRTCSAEDLLVHKCFAARPQDWLDVESVLDRQQGRLDLAQIRRELQPLAELKAGTDIMIELERLVKKVARKVDRATMPARRRGRRD